MDNLFSPAECMAAIWPKQSDIPDKKICCRHCRTINKVNVAKAVFNTKSCKCGKCGQPLFLAPDAAFTGLKPDCYEHPLDNSYLDALRKIPGFPQLVKWLMGQLTDRSLSLELLSDNIRCNKQQMPELVNLLQQTAVRLNIQKVPELYLGESPFINASTSGVERPVIVLKTALVDLLSPAEIAAVLGHEMGHLQSEHLLYHLLATFIIFGGQLFSDLGRLLSTPLRLAILKWYRCSELTADRAALLACGDLSVVLGMLIRLAGCPKNHSPKIALEPYIQQVRELSERESSSILDGVMSSFISLRRTHPNIAWRVMHLLAWIENGNYLNILAGEYQDCDSAN